MLGGELLGSFDEVRFIGDQSGALHACQTDRALVVISGARAGTAPEDVPASFSEAVSLIDAIGTDRLAWDLDGDGEVGFEDLRLLLASGVLCD